ncbi:MAG: DUF2164 domain-containing protein [Colwellia sp.]|nr:DUF2164 domain-containing protein [Colwellia sp.]MCW8865817.1 DUF2164 domain-containing protein [Colwellia sp.]MCW9081785.1 DUF2164 domain-containing protein [Colwellia sp.]
MTTIKLTTDDKSILINKIQSYLQTELDCDAGQFDTEFFLDFLTKELGGHFYNQGLYDAQTILANKIDDINEAISELEQVM